MESSQNEVCAARVDSFHAQEFDYVCSTCDAYNGRVDSLVEARETV